MKICSVNGTDIVIFTRNEHCPPHVHVSIKNCDLRLEFSFVHNDVRIWDATPDKNMPKLREIERLCVEMKKKDNLSRARKTWLSIIGHICLKNSYLMSLQDELSIDEMYLDKKIANAVYDTDKNVTILTIEGISDTIEVEL